MKQLLILFTAVALFAQPIVHPDSLSFDSLDWEIPEGTNFRSTIGETPFYYAKESLPLFSMRLLFKAGTFYGEGLNGVSTLWSSLLKNGGTEKKSPAELDSLLALYAINISASSSKSETAINISGLQDQFPRAMELLEELLKKPGFNEDRLARDKSVIKEKLAHRFDEPAPIMKATGLKLLYPGSALATLLTDEKIDAVTQKELKSFHSHILTESPLIIAFAGSIEKKEVEKAVLKLLPKKREVKEPTLTEPKLAPTHKTIIVQKPINQAYILIGQPLFKRPDERYYPLTLFNEVLGGGGFNSRLVSTVRSDAGLTYSIGSRIKTGYLYEGAFTVSLFTKSESVNHGLKLTIETITKTLNEEISAEEINEKRVQFVSSLPSSFRSGSDIVATYQNNEMMGRDISHYRDYPAALEKIELEEVLKTARESISADSFYTVIVGDTTELFNAPEWEGFSIKELKPLILTEDELVEFNSEKK